MKEVWKVSERYEVEVSNLGNIRYLDGSKVKTFINRGVLLVNAYPKGVLTHVKLVNIVGDMFANEGNKYYLNKDGNIMNCRADNIISTNNQHFRVRVEKKSIGERINQFDNSEHTTVGTFNSLFDSKINHYNENVPVEILELTNGNLRRILINGKESFIELK